MDWPTREGGEVRVGSGITLGGAVILAASVSTLLPVSGVSIDTTTDNGTWWFKDSAGMWIPCHSGLLIFIVYELYS